jgi:TonB-linked SusC/RagA family outer membrane protein
MNVTSVEKALQGSTPGLQVKTNSGQPGAAAEIRIRGVGSLNADANPLYVIDGVPVSASNYSEVADADYGTSTTILSTLNPNDIESITVLKDASAASVYGARAANGVVIITTKSGKRGEMKVDFKANRGYSDIAIERHDVLNASQYWKLYWDASYAELGDANLATDNTVSFLGVNPYNVDYPYNSEGNLVSGAELLYDADWRDAVYRIGDNQEYNLSASGGNESFNYFLSGGYSEQQGIVLASAFKRYTGKINLSSQVTDFLKIGSNTTLGYTDQDTPPGSGGAANPVRYSDIVANIYPIYLRDDEGNKIYDAAGNVKYDYQNPIVLDFNPLGISNMDIYNTQTGRALTSLFAEVNFLEDFTFKTLGSVDYVSLFETRYYNPLHGNGAGVDGRSVKYHTRDIRANVTNTLKWNRSFADMHTFDLTLGQEAATYRFDRITAGGTGFAFAGNDNLRAASTPVTTDSYYTEKTISSYFSILNYDLADKYYLSGSLRRDGSSVFGEDNKWGTFWSVGASWRVSQEGFMSGLGWLNNLKVRASYGTSGNDNIGRYESLGLFGLGFDYGGQPGLQYTQLANALLRWEKNINFNVGVDFRVFNRLSVEADYYNRISEDLLFEQPISFTTGFDDIMSNLATMENRGVELRLISTNIAMENFTWTTDFNIAFNTNEITKLTQDEVIVGSKRWVEGQDRYQFYIQEYAGVNSATGAAMWYKDILDEDENVIGRELTENYSEATRYEQGSALPDYFGGLTNTFSFKGLEFSFFFYYSMGGYLIDYTQQELMHDGGDPGQQLTTEVLDAWKEPGDVTDVPKFVIGNPSNSNGRSTRFLHDASYVRLRNISLSYTLPSEWTNTIKFRNVRVFAKADNIWTWRAYDGGVDPEQSFAGTSNYNFPPVKTFSFGVNLGF